MIKDKGDYYEIETIDDALKLLAELGYKVKIKNKLPRQQIVTTSRWIKLVCTISMVFIKIFRI